MIDVINIEKSSFRDPSGFLFYENGKLLRQINKSYQENYDLLITSTLYEKLTIKGLLVKHSELDTKKNGTDFYKLIEPEKVNFISYPYEWSFNQLKDAALTTLKIQKVALKLGMTLKDASAYNIQFHNGAPVFIDTLSFEAYKEGTPWVAYKQFCQHFLAPLALMSYTDLRLNQLLKIYIDGIPLDLASKLLPFKSKINLPLLMHLHLHANAQRKYEKTGSTSKKTTIPLANLVALIQNLQNTIRKLKINGEPTEWGAYYTFTNYSDKAFQSKKEIIAKFIKRIDPKTVWDLGANNGEFTRVAHNYGADCIAFDIDPLAVDANYRYIKKEGLKKIIPLVLDLTNPSPSIGWNNEERTGFKDRPSPDVIFALALIHHLAISNNIPCNRIAQLFSKLCKDLIIEFVPKSDSKVKKLLESRIDVFPRYNEESFVKDFEIYFDIIERKPVLGSDRVLFWMKRK